MSAPRSIVVIRDDVFHILVFEGSRTSSNTERYVCKSDDCGLEAWVDWRIPIGDGGCTFRFDDGRGPRCARPAGHDGNHRV